DREARIVSTIENVVAAKFAALRLRGAPVQFVSRDYFGVFLDTRVDYRQPDTATTLHPHFTEIAQSFPMKLERNRTGRTIETLWRTEFTLPLSPGPNAYYVSLVPQLSLLNKFGFDLDAPVSDVFSLRPADAVENCLVFVHSGRGNHYYLGDRRRIAFFQQEPDPFLDGRYFNGLGRFLLLRVERPTEKFYLRIAATRSLLSGRTAWSQTARVYSTTETRLGDLGDGAFNRIIGPLQPLEHRGAWFVAIDFEDIPKTIVGPRTGLKGLYHEGIPLDYRRLIGWARDISAVSEEKMAQLVRPTRVADFPADLVNATGLEFAGAYEDGWLSPRSEFTLGPSAAGGVLRLRGAAPDLARTPAGPATLLVTVGGREFTLPVVAGAFDWLLPIPAASLTTKVALRFSSVATLPGADARPVGAKLENLELLPALPGRIFDYSTVGAPRLAAHGIDQDGWLARRATIEVPALAAPATLEIKFECPALAGAAPNPLQVALAGVPTSAGHVLEPANYSTLRLPLPASAVPRTLTLEAATDYPLPAPDTRRRIARVLQLEIIP
ncbi:MAG: hypothetical protein RLZZ15_1947, partial [Verrucomicrobiota bacterium]